MNILQYKDLIINTDNIGKTTGGILNYIKNIEIVNLFQMNRKRKVILCIVI